MSALRDFAEQLRPCIGVRGEPTTTVVEAGAVRRFARAIGETHPVHHDPVYAAASRFGAVIAPPTFVAVLKGPGLPPLPAPPVSFRVYLHTGDRIRSFRPVRVGDVITSVPALADVFVKEGREGEMLFTTFGYEMTDAAGEPVATLAWTEVQFP